MNRYMKMEIREHVINNPTKKTLSSHPFSESVLRTDGMFSSQNIMHPLSLLWLCGKKNLSFNRGQWRSGPQFSGGMFPKLKVISYMLAAALHIKNKYIYISAEIDAQNLYLEEEKKSNMQICMILIEYFKKSVNL